MKKYRKKLTDPEFNAILKLTSHLKVDSVFDVYDCNETDKFKDWEEYKMVSLKTGLAWLDDVMVYSLAHDGMNEEESKLIVNLLIEFDIIDEERANYLLQPYDEEL